MHFKQARALMVKNFFGIWECANLYQTGFSSEQLRQLAEFPWDEDVLNSTCPLCGKRVLDCHFAFLGLDRVNGKPLTILKLQELFTITAEPRFYNYTLDARHPKEKFAAETTMSLRWYLLHTNIVPESEDKTYDEQKAMLPAEYEAPSAITEVAKDLLVFKKTGVYANPSQYGRCADAASGSFHHVRVGNFVPGGLGVGWCWDGVRESYIGIAASRKLPER